MEHTDTEIKIAQFDPVEARSRALPARQIMSLAMLCSDMLGILASVTAAALLRWLLIGPLTPEAFAWVAPFAAVFIVAATWRGLYPATGLSAVEQFRHLTIITTLLTLLITSFTFFFQINGQISRLFLALNWLACLVSIPLIRTVMRHLLVKAGVWGEPAVIIGGAGQAHSLSTYLRRYPKAGLKPEVIITLPAHVLSLTPLQREQLIENARQIKAGTHINTAIVSYEQMDEFGTIRAIFRDLFERVVMVNPADFGVDLGGVHVRQYGNMLTFEVRHTLMDRQAQMEKRLLDLFGSGIGLLLLSPLLGLLALLIAIDSPGGVFYRQRRLGKNGVEFDMLKFRTMHRNADAVLQEYLQQNPAARAEWDAYQKLHNDPRITRVGRFLRRFSLDELPQLWNVFIGEMSVVGPRPIMLNQRELYGPNLQHYMRVVPGITGLWQISGRNHTSFAQRTEFDVTYVMNWSIWLDIWILIRTIWVVLRRDGAC